jgi:glycosyltransferase involved in cell wall biosynthesis
MLKVSIIIPAYNSGTSIERAIKSVLEQTRRDYELIVVDDGSTDCTRRVLDPYIQSGDIRYIRQPNAGPSKARNTGAGVAKGEYLLFLDADDQMYSRRLQEQITFMDLNKDVLLGFADLDVLSPSNNQYGLSVFERNSALMTYSHKIIDKWFMLNERLIIPLLRHPFIHSSSVIVRQHAFKSVNGYNEAFRNAEDLLFYISISLIGKIGYTSCRVGVVVETPESLCRNTLRASLGHANACLVVLKTVSSLTKIETMVCRQTASEAFWSAGYYLFQNSELRQSRKYFTMSMSYSFSVRVLIYWMASFCELRLLNFARGLKHNLR